MTTRQTVVCDASALVALLADAGPVGTWATEQLRGNHLAAPHLVLVETANLLRRHEAANLLSADQAALAHRDLLALTFDQWPYELLAERAWQLRRNLTICDATYAALAELLNAPLVTLDGRIAKAPGLRCNVLVPVS